ncbi:hypothetical protein HD597_012337 [Nonomuraea thailandensis]|uniref:Uncharacterized protein n=1 Tax=Nonomuraea thailandensis TaxID=1188745 RepID=A0A9X2K936_9ACTN|nr:hypothetical protein [Nonomuraea thailandensis]
MDDTGERLMVSYDVIHGDTARRGEPGPEVEDLIDIAEGGGRDTSQGEVPVLRDGYGQERCDLEQFLERSFAGCAVVLATCSGIRAPAGQITLVETSHE